MLLLYKEWGALTVGTCWQVTSPKKSWNPFRIPYLNWNFLWNNMKLKRMHETNLNCSSHLLLRFSDLKENSLPGFEKLQPLLTLCFFSPRGALWIDSWVMWKILGLNGKSTREVPRASCDEQDTRFLLAPDHWSFSAGSRFNYIPIAIHYCFFFAVSLSQRPPWGFSRQEKFSCGFPLPASA